MRLLDRYIARTVITATCVVMLVLVGLESFMEFVTQLNDVGKGHYGIAQASLFVLMQLPTDLYQLFPMGGFLGSLIGLGRLANQSELIVMRASTVSVARIAWAVAKAAGIMLVVASLLGEVVAPQLFEVANDMKQTALGKAIDQKALRAIWLKRGREFIYVGRVASPTEIDQVIRYRFSPSRDMVSAEFAPVGRQVNGQWMLYRVVKSTLKSDRVQVTQLKQSPLGFIFKPALLQRKPINVGRESLVHVWQNIQYRRAAGLVTNQFEFSFWQRIFQPVSTLVLICLGIPFIFGSLRDASMGFRILIGIVIGFGFYMLNQLFGPMSLVYQFPPWLAAVIPTIVFLGIYVILLRHLRQ